MSKAQPVPPEGQVLQMVMGGWVSAAIAALSHRGVPDVLKKHGPLTAADIVSMGSLDAVPDALQRLLRANASFGLLSEDADGRFGLTPLSEALTSDAAAPIKKLAEAMGGHWLRMMTELSESVRTGKNQSKKLFGMDWWDYLNANPQELEDFGEAMKANSYNSLLGVLEHCDFSGVRSLCDVGGGWGHLAVALLKKYPALKASVLDVPDLIPVAKKSFTIDDPAVSSRFEYVGGNMFSGVPPAEVYVMKHIIHDWEDDYCTTLLKNCRQSMVGNGRIVCVDSVVPPMGDTGGTPNKMLDLLMLAGINGRERTEAQWNDLYGAAGFEVARITPLQDNFGTSIVEGVKRG